MQSMGTPHELMCQVGDPPIPVCISWAPVCHLCVQCVPSYGILLGAYSPMIFCLLFYLPFIPVSTAHAEVP